jgi:predicted porin
MPLITAFRWDTGVQVRIGPERLNAGIAVTNGTTSDPRTRDNNSGKQIAGRIHWKPNAGLTIGASAAHGAYVSDAALATATLVSGTLRSAQTAFGADAEYSRDHWLLRGELIWNQWQVPTLSRTLDATSVFVEGRYKISPGLFVATRFDRLGFSDLASATARLSWDAPVTRLETGAGYYIRRNLVAKGSYQHNWRNGGSVRTLGLFAMQLHFWL